MNGEWPRPAPSPAGRPTPPPAAAPVPSPSTFARPAATAAVPAAAGPAQRADAVAGSGHPAVDAALQGIANAAALAPADQIAQYEAAHRVLRETLATIDQS